MNTIPRPEFDALIDGATLLEEDRRGPKVYETTSGRIVKLFRIKRRFSSNLWSPFATRFAKNAQQLASIKLPSITVEATGWVPHIERQMVVYAKLEGRPLRHVLRDAPADQAAECLRAAGRFIADVQEHGVFFRSFHFGNILVKPDGSFALIDILDVWFKSSPLGLWRRGRNFRHMTRYPQDRAALIRHWDAFREGYLDVSLTGSLRDKKEKLVLILETHRRTLNLTTNA